MRTILLATALFAGMCAYSQTTYNGLPVIKAGKNIADYRFDENWSRGSWGIAPEASPDVLEVPCFNRTVSFAFYTDKDSIAFPLAGSQAKQFYVLTEDGKYALTEIRGFNFEPAAYDASPKKPAYTFWYEDGQKNDYLESFKAKHPVHTLVAGLSADSAKALRIVKWVHDQWRHNGENQPKKKDALSILEEVKEGKNFRCVEYGIVATTALNAIGLPARVLALKTKDVETTPYGAGHVLLEVYLKDMQKWVLLDGQWDAMPVLDGVPLNAVEFQQAIANHYDRLQIRSLSGTSKLSYARWIFPYLYYMDASFDNREGIDRTKEMQAGKKSLMLVPEGAKQPTVFQKQNPIDYVIYTNSLADFYAPPR